MKIVFPILFSVATLVAFAFGGPVDDRYYNNGLGPANAKEPPKPVDYAELPGVPGSKVPRVLTDLISRYAPGTRFGDGSKRGLDGFQWVELPGLKGSKVPDFIAYWFTLPYQFMWRFAQEQYLAIEYGTNDEEAEESRKRSVDTSNHPHGNAKASNSFKIAPQRR